MKIDKCDKLICNLYDKNNYVVQIKSLKQALNHGLILKKVHKVISFNKKAWMKDYIITTMPFLAKVWKKFEMAET